MNIYCISWFYNRNSREKSQNYNFAVSRHFNSFVQHLYATHKHETYIIVRRNCCSFNVAGHHLREKAKKESMSENATLPEFGPFLADLRTRMCACGWTRRLYTVYEVC